MACLVYVLKNSFLFSKIRRIRKIGKTCFVLYFSCYVKYKNHKKIIIIK